MKPHEIMILVMIGLILVFLHGGAHAVEEKGNELILSKEDMAKLQKFIAGQQKQLASAKKEIEHLTDEYLALKECVMTKARQGVPTTTCFQDCNEMGMDCHPSTVEY